MKTLIIFLFMTLLTPPLLSQEVSHNDEDLLGDDFGTDSQVIPKPRGRRFFFLGKIIKGELYIAHFNDLDLTGIAGLLGYPDDDDLGRTAGLVINYLMQGSDGSLEFNLENWLFSRETNNPDVEDEQVIHERSVVSIRSRRFTDNNSNRYIIMGLEFGYDVQKPFIMSFVQKFVHDITPSRDRPIVGRDERSFMLTPIFGVGQRFDVVDNERINIYATGEIEAQASTAFFERSAIRARVRSGISVAGWQGIEPPLVKLSLLMEYAHFLDGGSESRIGLELSFGFRIGNSYIQPGIAVTRWTSRLDSDYEGDASWNTAIFIRISFLNDEDEDESDYLIDKILSKNQWVYTKVSPSLLKTN